MAYEHERNLIDPGGQYPADGLRRVEQRALEVAQARPGAVITRTRDVVQLEWGGEEGIVALVTAEALELRFPVVEWTGGSYGPAMSSRLWRRFQWDELPPSQLGVVLQQAQAARDAEYRECVYCHQRFTPDRMTGDACHGCASKHLGILY